MANVVITEVGEPSSLSSPKELKNALYARCASLPADKAFNQQDLLAFNIIPNDDLNQLLSCATQLAKEGLFKLMTRDGKPCWKVVKKEDAAKYKTLSAEEALVYSYIESSGREGIWTRTIRTRTNLHQTVMNRCLKTLEAKNYIKPVKSAKNVGRKMYMIASLQPSEDVTGGPFYTDGVLDEEFVHQMANWSEKYIIARSWWHPPSRELARKREKTKLTQEQAEELRAQELGKEMGGERNKSMLPMPPGYTGYPTVPEITKALNASGLSGIIMKEAEMRQLLDVLCWDGLLEKVMDGKAYKAVRRVRGQHGEGLGNGLTEAPCGRCPVFNLCEEGGPVNARNCEYFQDWLAI